MRIPLADQSVRQDSRIRQAGPRDANRTAAALGNLAQQVGAIGNDMIDTEIRQKHAADRLAATRSLMEYGAGGKERANAVAERLRRGEFANEEEAEAEYRAQIDELDAGDLPAVGSMVIEDLKLGRQRLRGSLDAAFGEALRATRVERAEINLVGALDDMGRQAGMADADLDGLDMRGDAAVKAYIEAGGDASRAAGLAMKARESRWASAAGARLVRSADSMDSLKALEADLAADDGVYAQKLDPDRRMMLVEQVRGAKSRLTAKWEAAAAKRDANARRVLETYQQVTASGFPVGDDLREEARRATKGTEYEQQFTDALDDERAVAEMLTMPVQEQQAFIVRRERELRTAKVNDPKEIRRFAAMAKAFDQNIKSLSESPIEWHEARTGEDAPTLAPQMFLTNEGLPTVARVLRDRVATLDSIGNQFGVPVASPLKKEEAQQLGEIIKSQSATKRAETLGFLYRAIGDDAAYRGAVKQMFGDDPRAMAAGIAHGMNLRTTEGRNIGELIEQGSVILQDKTVISPKAGSADDGTKAAFNSYVTLDMLPPGGGQRDAYYQSALAIYAKLAAEDGALGRTLNEKLFQRAVRMAVGGIVEYRGMPMVPPRYGMDEDEFSDKMDAALSAAARTNGIDFNPGDMRLVPDDNVPGRYYVWRDAYRAQPDKNGRPLFVEIR